MKLRVKMPPGNFVNSSASIASRKRTLIFVAVAISCNVTPRISRSRRRFSPKEGIEEFLPSCTTVVNST
jgi:hypothetical protein